MNEETNNTIKSSFGEKSSDEIIAHNEMINQMINTYTLTKNKYQNVSKQAKSIINGIKNFTLELKECNKLLEKIIISNRPVGNGELLIASHYAEEAEGTFRSIISVCDQKIADIDDKIAALKGQYW